MEMSNQIKSTSTLDLLHYEDAADQLIELSERLECIRRLLYDYRSDQGPAGVDHRLDACETLADDGQRYALSGGRTHRQKAREWRGESGRSDSSSPQAERLAAETAG